MLVSHCVFCSFCRKTKTTASSRVASCATYRPCTRACVPRPRRRRASRRRASRSANTTTSAPAARSVASTAADTRVSSPRTCTLVSVTRVVCKMCDFQGEVCRFSCTAEESCGSDRVPLKLSPHGPSTNVVKRIESFAGKFTLFAHLTGKSARPNILPGVYRYKTYWKSSRLQPA